MLKDDVQNDLKAAHMASEDTQKVMLRMDNLEYEWLLWNDAHHAGGAADVLERVDGAGPERERVGGEQPMTTTSQAALPTPI